jgi:hypothetical protein
LENLGPGIAGAGGDAGDENFSARAAEIDDDGDHDLAFRQTRGRGTPLPGLLRLSSCAGRCGHRRRRRSRADGRREERGSD